MIYGAMLVKNESGRWLRKVLEQMKMICDKIIILDDHSTDETPEICREYGEVFYSDKSLWGTNELIQRKLLWDLVNVRPGDWILCLDADETFEHPDQVRKYIQLAEQYGCDGLGFPLYDMWNSEEYRDDEFWTAHNRLWIMAIMVRDKDYVWKNTTLHCGRFPENVNTQIAQCPIKIQHWGWSRPEDRKLKYERYMLADPDGKNGSLEQYKSILDPEPNLRRFV
jgi:glycosyltransferase involved in cell wall biosynthesis